MLLHLFVVVLLPLTYMFLTYWSPIILNAHIQIDFPADSSCQYCWQLFICSFLLFNAFLGLTGGICLFHIFFRRQQALYHRAQTLEVPIEVATLTSYQQTFLFTLIFKPYLCPFGLQSAPSSDIDHKTIGLFFFFWLIISPTPWQVWLCYSRHECLVLFLHPQAEQELRMTQSEFDRQAEITRLLLEGVSSTHVCKSAQLDSSSNH